MKITVILCTYNRCASLRKALESVAQSNVSESRTWEVIVVDNNSRDETRKVTEEFSLRYPSRFRYIFESQQGKSFALNTAIREADGEVLAFMDDDVTVEPKWLENLTAELSTGEWCGAGGRILPASAFPTPPWLPLKGPYNMGGMLALFDQGDAAKELDSPPFGTNMAFRKEVFSKHGNFRTDLGPCPGSEIRNEDTEFGRRVMAAGQRIRYEPFAVVFHDVPAKRLTKEYFLTFWFDCGRATIRELVERPDVLGVPRCYLTLLKHIVVIMPTKIIQWFFGVGIQARFYRKCWVWYTAGEIVEIYRRWFSRSGRRGSLSTNIQSHRTVVPPAGRIE